MLRWLSCTFSLYNIVSVILFILAQGFYLEKQHSVHIYIAQTGKQDAASIDSLSSFKFPLISPSDIGSTGIVELVMQIFREHAAPAFSTPLRVLCLLQPKTPVQASPCFTCDFADMMFALERNLGLHCSHDDGEESSTPATLLPPCGKYADVYAAAADFCRVSWK